MDPSDRLDALVERARALFEAKYGSSKGCFAAFSPAKVNLMGDFVEGSGGLVLQMAIDRRVVVFGRGRVVPELRRNDGQASPRGDLLRRQALDQEQETHEKEAQLLPPQHEHERTQQQEHHVEGKNHPRRQTARPRTASIASEEEFTLQPVPRWPKNGKKVGKAIMDAMVQDLVFGRKGRGSSVTAAPTDSASSTPGGADWVKIKGGSGHTPSSPVPSSSRHSSRHGGGSGPGGRGRASWSPTPSTARDDSSSRHSSSRSSVPTPSDHEGALSSTTTTASYQSKVGPAGGPSGAGGVMRSGGLFNVPPIQVPGPSAEEIMVSRGRSASVDSGSTTTEEAFPADSGGFGSSNLSSNETVRGDGAGTGVGSNGSEAGGKTVGSKSAGAAASNDGKAMQKSYSRSSSSSSIRRRVSSRDAGAGVLSETEASAHGSTSGSGNARGEEGVLDMEAFPSSQSGSEPGGPPSLHAPASPESRPSAYGSGAGARALCITDSTDIEGSEAGGRVSRLDEGELARALADAARAKADIEEAEAAERERAEAHIRACRVYCDACPKDGVVEFVAERGMRAGGDNWQGLLTAVVSEYAHEVQNGEVLGLEAVVVSDLPGRTGPEMASAIREMKVAQEGAGHGWGETARSALLMATATFLEEVLEMGRFPRMKALRCFSAAMKCRRRPEQNGEKKSWSGAAPTPFGSEEALRGSDGGCGAVGSSWGGETAWDKGSGTEGGISLEDLLAIADDDPPGAVLLDSKTRTYWPIPMKGPKEDGLVVVIAQPLDLETAQRLRWQAEHERERCSATCRAVVAVAKEHHPEASCLRDVPAETLEALLSVGTSRGQAKGGCAVGSGAVNNDGSWSSSRGGSDKSCGSGSIAGGHASSTGMPFGSGYGRAVARRRLTTEVLAHARHLAAEVQRVREVAAAFTVGDMETVVKVMLQSRRSAALSISGNRGRPEPPEPAAVRLAQMASRLPGVYASRQSEGRGSAATGAVFALVEPESVEGIMRAIATRGVTTTAVAWGGFAARPGGGSGIIRVV